MVAVNAFGCGCSSVVEHDLAKVGVEGSSPFARSKNLTQPARPEHGLLRLEPDRKSADSIVKQRSSPRLGAYAGVLAAMVPEL